MLNPPRAMHRTSQEL